MSGNPIRLRRHTDGRVALSTPKIPRHISHWAVFEYGAVGDRWVCDEAVTGPGWTELLVAELPEPDGSLDVPGSSGEAAKTPYWTGVNGSRVTAWLDGVETEGDGLIQDLAGLRANALKVLAAEAACERLQKEARTGVR